MTNQIGRVLLTGLPEIGAGSPTSSKANDRDAPSGAQDQQVRASPGSDLMATSSLAPSQALTTEPRRALMPRASMRPRNLLFQSASQMRAADPKAVAVHTELKPGSDAAGQVSRDDEPDTAKARPRGWASRSSKLLALATVWSTVPQAGDAFVGPTRGPRRVPTSPGLSFDGRLIKRPEDLRKDSHAGSLTRLGDTNGPGGDRDGGGLHFEDFGDFLIGSLPDSPLGNPDQFLRKFRQEGSYQFDAGALKAHGYKKKIEARLTEIAGLSQESSHYGPKLDALSWTCIEFLTLLSSIAPCDQYLPVFHDVNDDCLALVNDLYLLAGNDEARFSFLSRTEKICSENKQHSALDSAFGKMLSRLSESIQREVRESASAAQTSAWGGVRHSLRRDALMSILTHHQGMLEARAQAESRSGNYEQAVALLQQCESIVSNRITLNPGAASSEPLRLSFDILKSQILADDDEAAGTLETLYMLMLAHAENHEDRFSAQFPRDTFVAALDDAYVVFLDELESDQLTVSLAHPIAQLFLEAKMHGVMLHSTQR